MKFTFKKYIKELVAGSIIIDLIVIVLFIISNYLFAFFLLIILILINVDIFKNIRKIKRYLEFSSEDEIKILEEDLSNSYFIYDSWYLTDYYMFSLKELIKINYKDIMVIDGGLTFVSSTINNLGYKQTIYLKNGENMF